MPSFLTVSDDEVCAKSSEKRVFQKTQGGRPPFFCAKQPVSAFTCELRVHFLVAGLNAGTGNEKVWTMADPEGDRSIVLRRFNTGMDLVSVRRSSAVMLLIGGRLPTALHSICPCEH